MLKLKLPKVLKIKEVNIMEENKKEIIEHYESYISSIETIIDAVDNDKLLDRQHRNRFITFLDKSVLHCKGMISVINGTYQPKRKE